MQYSDHCLNVTVSASKKASQKWKSAVFGQLVTTNKYKMIIIIINNMKKYLWNIWVVSSENDLAAR